MKKLFIAICVFFCASCTSDEPESAIINGNVNSDSTEMESVTIHFSPQYDIRPMTRAAIGDAASRLDVWIYEGDTELTAIHQSSSDVGFGSVQMSLNKTNTYTLYALAHKATAACTIADGIIETKTFDAVPIRNSYRTTYSGYFFTTEGMTMTFTCDDWNDYDTINF